MSLGFLLLVSVSTMGEMQINWWEIMTLEQCLKLPSSGTKTFEHLVTFMDEERDALLPYLQWFTVEMLSTYGARDTLTFLSTNSSKRVQTKTVFECLERNERFARVVTRNCSEGWYLEVQSASGFWEAIRSYHIEQKIDQGLRTSDIAHQTGASIRTIQRLRKRARAD
jgi:hypothetical protein